MEQVYSVQRRAGNCLPQNCEWRERILKCSVSSRNALAFSCDSLDSLGRLSSFRVYVVDLNIPWEPWLVLSHDEEVTCLEWDASGTKLMVADAVGSVHLLQMKSFLLNEWKLVSKTEFPGEHIIAGTWFHNGKKVAVNTDKKESSLYLEKYAHLKFGPSMRRVGGKPCEGCIAVSASGLVCVVVVYAEDNVVKSCETLAQFRNRLQLVDVFYGNNGDFLVVTSDGLVQSAIHCFRIALKIIHDKCQVNCQPFSSFYLNCLQPKDVQWQRVSHLKFILKEATDAVVVSVTNSTQSLLEVWELREKPVTFHPNLAGVSEQNKITTVGWQLHAVATHNSPVAAVTTPRLCLFDVSSPPAYIIVAFKDASLKCYSRDKLTLISSNSALLSPHGVKGQLHSHVTDMSLSSTGCILVSIDNWAQLSLYRLSPITEPGGPMSAAYAVTVLEHCLMSGADWWDVLISLRPGLIEKVSEKMCEVFEKQPIGVQQFFQSRFLALRGSLYRCLNTGFVKAGDCHAQMMLSAVSCVVKGLLRPRDMSKMEGAAHETLSALINDRAQVVNSIDKALVNLDTKEFFVEPALLPSVQHHVQWVSDLALHLMSSLPLQVYQHQRFPGGGLISDAKSINTLRELLVIFRIWGLISESCLPVYTRMVDNMDVLGTLFRLLTKTLMNHGSEPDSSLLDECSVLASQVLIPSLDLGSASHGSEGVCGPALFIHHLPLILEFHSMPDFLRAHNHKTASTVEGCVKTSSYTDIVRHISLGKHVDNVRKCTRCFSMSMQRSSIKLSAMRAWEQRWLRNCPCGGQWMLLHS